MIELIRFSFLVCGALYLTSTAAITRPLRVWFLTIASWLKPLQSFLGALVYCSACSGFWLGGLLWILGVAPFKESNVIEAAVVALAVGAIWEKLTGFGTEAFFQESPSWLVEKWVPPTVPPPGENDGEEEKTDNG